MSMQDPIANMLTCIRNGQSAYKNKIFVNYSKINKLILKIFNNEGYINKYNLLKINNISKIIVYLKYFNKLPVIKKIKRISKPGLRIYSDYKKLPIMMSGLGIYIISTSLGLLTDKDARKNKVGGEIICSIF